MGEYELLKEKIKTRQRLSEAEQMKLLERKNLSLLEWYLLSHRLCQEAELKLLEQEHAVELLRTYMANSYLIVPAAQIKLVKHKDSAKLLRVIRHHKLCLEAQDALLRQDNAVELLEIYLSGHDYSVFHRLDPGVEFLLVTHKDSEKLLKRYFRDGRHRLSPMAEVKFLERHSRDDLDKLYGIDHKYTYDFMFDVPVGP